MTPIRRIYKATISLCSVLVLTCASGCVTLAQDRGESSERVIPWPDRVNNILEAGTSGDYFWAAYSKPPAFHVWQWSDLTVAKCYELPYTERTFTVLMLPHERWLASVDEGFCIGDLKSGKVISRWPKSDKLDISLQQASQNGKHFAAVAWDEVGGSYNYKSMHVGLILPDDRIFQWAATLTPDYGDNVDGTTSRTIPSNSGKFIGVPGWDNGVAMIDVVNKKVLWTASHNHLPRPKDPRKRNNVPWKGVPLDALSVDDLAFTPDDKTVYVGGTIASDSVGAAGCVWEIRVETGEVVSQWGTADPKPDEYSRSVTTVSVSPDGRYVAAGTVPKGLVFLYSTKDGQRRIINHGSPATIDFASFSHDSKRLATYAANYAKEIKIWKLPEEEAESKPDKSTATKEAAK